MSLQKQTPLVSKKLRDAAKGERCTLEVVCVCNHDPDTSVLCHVRDFGGGGMGLKPDDMSAVIACSDCHDWLDRRKYQAFEGVEGDRYWYIARAVDRTHRRWVEKGLITVKGMK